MDYLSQINNATTIAQLSDTRYGANGFETAYYGGLISYDSYLYYYNAYVVKYNQLSAAPIDYLSLIAAATTYAQLNDLYNRFTADYYNSLISYSTYLTYYNAYADRYSNPAPNPSLVANYLGQISNAITLAQLDIIRYGTSGFETWYLTELVARSDYLTIYDSYLVKYNQIINPIPATTDYLSLIAAATTLQELSNTRFGTNGFETAYFNGLISFDKYVIYDAAYKQKYDLLYATTYLGITKTANVSLVATPPGEIFGLEITLMRDDFSAIALSSTSFMATGINQIVPLTVIFEKSGYYSRFLTLTVTWGTHGTILTQSFPPITV